MSYEIGLSRSSSPLSAISQWSISIYWLMAEIMRIFKYSLARSGLAAQLLGEGGEDGWRRRKVVEKKGGREER